MQPPPGIEVEPPRHFRLREAGFPARHAITAADAIRAGADYVVVGSPIWRAAEPLRAVREITDDIERGLRNSPRRTFEILNPRPLLSIFAARLSFSFEPNYDCAK